MTCIFPKTGYIYTAQSITTMPGPIKWCVNKPSDKLQTAYKANGSSNDHMRYHTHSMDLGTKEAVRGNADCKDC